eukprot:gnl/Ergobibamus_cyprinoides/602.p1 GENE.gnl/Ergobibamus_cyprinoides/602~~gnl/Ergobibamus_cyprinoides/602.p1  ORF type:complete len:369 (+),score=77.12 gnl/Ergobibamus_cyprinoides/602:39-1109(+)
MSAFETNLETWRQLWRVGERSSVIAIVVDARCPFLHLPLSFLDYARHAHGFDKPVVPTIVVLNKTDLVSAAHVQAWTVAVQAAAPFASVLPFSSIYRVEEGVQGAGKTRGRVATPEFVARFVAEARRISGIPSPEPCTVGFYGQPSVGKSSLFNALLGKKATGVSLTAGKTKHLQTFFLDVTRFLVDADADADAAFASDAKPVSPDVDRLLVHLAQETDRSFVLCDCPGLVLPVRHISRALQVLAGVCPLGRVREFESALRVLLENALAAGTLPALLQGLPRGAAETSSEVEPLSDRPTPVEVLEHVALSLGFLTRGGAPNRHRVGHHIAKLVIQGEVPFAVPAPDPEAVRAVLRP